MEQNNGTALPPPRSISRPHPSSHGCYACGHNRLTLGKRKTRKEEEEHRTTTPYMDRLNYDSAPFVSTGVQVSHCFISFSSIKMISRGGTKRLTQRAKVSCGREGRFKELPVTQVYANLSGGDTVLHAGSRKTQPGSVTLGKGLLDGWKTTALMSYCHLITVFLIGKLIIGFLKTGMIRVALSVKVKEVQTRKVNEESCAE